MRSCARFASGEAGFASPDSTVYSTSIVAADFHKNGPEIGDSAEVQYSFTVDLLRAFCKSGTWNPIFCKAGTFLQSWNLFALRVHSQHASMPT